MPVIKLIITDFFVVVLTDQIYSELYFLFNKIFLYQETIIK